MNNLSFGKLKIWDRPLMKARTAFTGWPGLVWPLCRKLYILAGSWPPSHLITPEIPAMGHMGSLLKHDVAYKKTTSKFHDCNTLSNSGPPLGGRWAMLERTQQAPVANLRQSTCTRVPISGSGFSPQGKCCKHVVTSVSNSTRSF